jgi:phage tail-like protein
MPPKRPPVRLAAHFGFKITEGDLKADYLGGTAFFRNISGIKNDTEVTDFQEGGVISWTRKVIGVRKWPNLVLKNGFTGDTKLFKWKFAPNKRVNGIIVQLGENMQEVCRWEFYNGYPVKWEGPDFDANKNEIAIETLEIAHEGLYMPGPTPPQPPPPPTPAPPPPPPLEAEVKFPTNGFTPIMSPELQAIKDAIADPNDQRKWNIDADTDSEGSASYNKDLSQKRANGVRDSLGGPGPKIARCNGYGKDRALGNVTDPDPGQATIKDNTNSAAWRRTKVTEAK